MTRTLLHPPRSVHNFRFAHGCGEAHEYDGETGIDCGPCIEHVRTLSPDERIMHPALRGPAPAVGATPEERERMLDAYQAARDAATWRLEEAEPKRRSKVAGAEPTGDDLAMENERLRARLAELEAGTAAEPAQAAEEPAEEPPHPAHAAGKAAAAAGISRQNPFDGRSAAGRHWYAGYDSVEEPQRS